MCTERIAEDPKQNPEVRRTAVFVNPTFIENILNAIVFKLQLIYITVRT